MARCSALPLAIAAAVCGSASAQTPAATAAQIATAERRLPWLWSYSVEGIADIPYTYKVTESRRLFTRAGKEIPPTPGASGLAAWRTVQLERIPLEWGSFLRCLSQDGVSPCSGEWNLELEREGRHRDALTPEERQRIDARREERRQRRRSFWDDFPAAFRFEAVGPSQIRFTPLARFKPQHSVAGSVLTAMDGRLTFDSATSQIVRMEYNLTRDVDEPFARLAKGSHFEIELSQSEDGHYLPRVITTRRVHKGGQIDESTAVYANFKRFESQTNIQFGDPKDR